MNDKIESLLDSLENLLYEAEKGQAKWKEVWYKIKNIGKEFKVSSFPTRQERQNAWDRFQSIIAEVKERQEEAKKEFNRKLRDSEYHLDEINSYASRATPSSEGADFIMHLVTGGLTAYIKAGIDAILGSFDERKYELQKCNEAMKDGWSYFSANKSEMFGKHKREAFEALRNASDELNDAWDNWKVEKQNAFDRYHEERRAEKEAKHEAWEDRMRANHSKLEDRLNRLESALDRRRSILSDLEEKRSSAWSDSFIDRVDGWISEEEDRISDIERKIDQVKDWISEIEEKLN